MKISRNSVPARARATQMLLSLSVCCVLALAAVAPASAAAAPNGSSLPGQTESGGASTVSATLEQCVSTGEQLDRSATFSGDMTALLGTTRMAIRIDVQERMRGEELFHTVAAPGLGVWRGSAPGVKIYQYVKQVTNLSGPAVYRALIRFHWLGVRGHVIKRAERITAKCEQPAPPQVSPPTSPSSPSPSPGASASPGAGAPPGASASPSATN